jgi:hypothetical protein
MAGPFKRILNATPAAGTSSGSGLASGSNAGASGSGTAGRKRERSTTGNSSGADDQAERSRAESLAVENCESRSVPLANDPFVLY